MFRYFKKRVIEIIVVICIGSVFLLVRYGIFRICDIEELNNVIECCINCKVNWKDIIIFWLLVWIFVVDVRYEELCKRDFRLYERLIVRGIV